MSLDEEDGDGDKGEDEHVEGVCLLPADDVVVGELVAGGPLAVVLDILFKTKIHQICKNQVPLNLVYRQCSG